MFINFFWDYNIILRHSTTYHPHGNALAYSSNKVKFLKKTIAQNKRNWDSQLKFSLWANRVTTKQSTGKYPFDLVYGVASIFPTQLVILVAKLIQYVEEDPIH